MKFSGTYDPADNKCRLRASSRLDKDLYQRVRKAGFIWAPKQDLFVAPMWTPEREDLLIELCGEIDDEDTSLVDRAEQRAERFEIYSDKRETEAHRAHEAVAAIAEGIPLGQPILVGHHSERHARKDAQRIENGMRRAVKLWETSTYWSRRAEAAKSHAKYKELPTVRARRIKTIQADKRKQERELARSEKLIAQWSEEALTNERALQIANQPDCYSHYCFTLAKYPRNPPASQYEGLMSLWSALCDGIVTAEQARELTLPNLRATVDRCKRWLIHFEMRLVYESCMLEEAGYVEPKKVKSLKASLPLLNYRAESISYDNPYHRGSVVTIPQVEMTKAEYSKIYKDYKGTAIVERSHKMRTAVSRTSKPGERGLCAVFLTDSKVHEKPALGAEPALPAPRMPRPRAEAPAPTVFDAMKSSLKTGVQVVSAPQLFPTPPEIAERMVELAGVEPGHVVVEPSAGTGRILLALDNVSGIAAITVHAVEINALLAKSLREGFTDVTVHEGDFLAYEYSRQNFADRVIMNPPFADGADIKHILHAISILKPGGRVVALCANGPRQQAQLKPRASHWEELPDGSFAAQGTGVRVALAVYEAQSGADGGHLTTSGAAE